MSQKDSQKNESGSSGISSIIAVVVGMSLVHATGQSGGESPANAAAAIAQQHASTGSCWMGVQPCALAYSQCDPAWKSQRFANGTMCENGCGPAAMAMIITALKGTRVTPAETGKYAHDMKLFLGGASKHTIAPELAKRWGLRAEKIPGSVEAITKAVQGGGLVIMSGHGQLPFVPSKDPNAGHYLVVRSIENGQIQVGNSAFPATNSKRYNLASLTDNIHETSVYAVFGP